ncbi:MAG: Rieske 2Fe-2S domain-containing protein [Devosia sp.]|nr:Rieske 2Fe-2S domain-containing protein [Devosia sp.]
MSGLTVSKWVAVARAASLGRRPLAVTLDGLPLVLFRTPEGIRALTDRCPHRSAPLSGGRVVGAQIECPYHGWRFDGGGRCRAMPGLIGEVPRALVPAHEVIERDGLVFVATAKDPGTPYVGALSGRGTVSLRLENRVTSTLAEVAENILDATHTHFTHRGVLRGLSPRRYTVEVTVTGGDGWVEASYVGEPRQEGLVSRLLEGERAVSIGRFISPGIVELEFRGPDGPRLVTTFHLRQAETDTVRGVAVLSGPSRLGLGYLKAALFFPLFRLAVEQDQRILSAAHARRLQFPDIRQMSTPLDVMRPHIDAILAGRRPSVADAPARLVMSL